MDRDWLAGCSPSMPRLPAADRPLGAGRPNDTHLVVDDWVIIPIGANLRLE